MVDWGVQNPVIAGMAAIRSREDILPYVIDSLYPQVTRLFIYGNDYPEPPRWITKYPKVEFWAAPSGDLGDRAKFYACDKLGRNHYFLAVDDDLVYPPNYVRRTLELIERYARRAVVSWHGKILRLPGPWADYFRQAAMASFRCLGGVEADVVVHVPGSGVLGFHAETYVPDWFDMTPTNMADIHVGAQCNDRSIPVVVGAHPQGWILHAPIDHETTLWTRYQREGDRLQTTVLNNVQWKPLTTIQELRP